MGTFIDVRTCFVGLFPPVRRHGAPPSRVRWAAAPQQRRFAGMRERGLPAAADVLAGSLDRSIDGGVIDNPAGAVAQRLIVGHVGTHGVMGSCGHRWPPFLAQ